MLSISIDQKKVGTMLALAPEKTKSALRKSLQQSSLFVQNDAKKLAPHDTGQLRRSITHKVHGYDYAEVGTNLVYAAIQEYGGTIKAKNKPYLRFKTKSGNWVRVKSVVIKAKKYMEGSYKKNINKVVKTFEKNLDAIFK